MSKKIMYHIHKNTNNNNIEKCGKQKCTNV